MSKIAAKVEAVNKANREANRLDEVLKDYFLGFLGQKIVKKDGSLMATVTGPMPDLPKSPDMRVIVSLQGSSNLICSVTGIVSAEGGWTVYHEAKVWIGKIDSGVLVTVNDTNMDRPTDCTVERVERLRKLLGEAKERVRELESLLGSFGEYDW